MSQLFFLTLTNPSYIFYFFWIICCADVSSTVSWKLSLHDFLYLDCRYNIIYLVINENEIRENYTIF